MRRRVHPIKYVHAKRERFGRLRVFPRKRVRGSRRPRGEGSKRLISVVVRDRWDNWLRSGMAEILGPRRVRINLPQPDEPGL